MGHMLFCAGDGAKCGVTFLKWMNVEPVDIDDDDDDDDSGVLTCAAVRQKTARQAYCECPNCPFSAMTTSGTMMSPVIRSDSASATTSKLVTELRRLLCRSVTSIRAPLPSIMSTESIGSITCFSASCSFDIILRPVILQPRPSMSRGLQWQVFFVHQRLRDVSLQRHA